MRYARWGILGVIAALGVTLLAIIVGPHRVGDYFTETDFYGAYALGAAALEHGHLDPARYGVIGPVYEIVLAALGFVVRNLFVAAELISLVATLVTAWLWAWLIERRADVRLALAALLTTRTTRGMVGAGVLAALAFLTRYNAVVLAPAGLVAIALGGALHPNRRAALIAFAGGFAALTLPWIAFSLTHGGQIASQLHHNIAFDVFARPQGMVWDDYQRKLQPQFHSLADVIARDPGAVFQRELFNVFDHLRLDARELLGWPTALAAAAGAILLVLDRGARRLAPLWLAGALGFLVLVPAFHSSRYSLALLPMYATLAGAAFALPRLAFAVANGRVWLKALLAVLPLSLTLLVTQRETARVLDQLPTETLEAARVLRGLARPGDRILLRKPHVAWLGGVEAVAFPITDSVATLGRYAHQNRVRWMFFSWPEAELRPEFAYLIDTSATMPGLTVRWSSPRRAAVLYEIGPELGTEPAWMRNDTLFVYHRARARLAMNPNEVRSLRAVAFVDSRDGRDPEARALLERALSLAPDDAPGWSLLGEACLRLGDATAAIDAFEHSARLDPSQPRTALGLGWAYLMAHRPDDAARAWRPAVSATADPATLRRMAELFEQQGDHAAADAARAALGGTR